MKLHELDNIDKMTPALALTKMECNGGINNKPCNDCVGMLNEYVAKRSDDLIKAAVKRVPSDHRGKINIKYLR